MQSDISRTAAACAVSSALTGWALSKQHRSWRDSLPAPPNIDHREGGRPAELSRDHFAVVSLAVVSREECHDLTTTIEWPIGRDDDAIADFNCDPNFGYLHIDHVLRLAILLSSSCALSSVSNRCAAAHPREAPTLHQHDRAVELLEGHAQVIRCIGEDGIGEQRREYVNTVFDLMALAGRVQLSK